MKPRLEVMECILLSHDIIANPGVKILILLNYDIHAILTKAHFNQHSSSAENTWMKVELTHFVLPFYNRIP
jgi:hypothetical protein